MAHIHRWINELGWRWWVKYGGRGWVDGWNNVVLVQVRVEHVDRYGREVNLGTDATSQQVLWWVFSLWNISCLGCVFRLIVLISARAFLRSFALQCIGVNVHWNRQLWRPSTLSAFSWHGRGERFCHTPQLMSVTTPDK